MGERKMRTGIRNILVRLLMLSAIMLQACSVNGKSDSQTGSGDFVLEHIKNMEKQFTISCDDPNATAEDVKQAIIKACENENYYRWLWSGILIQMDINSRHETMICVDYIMTKKQQEYVDYNVPIIVNDLVKPGMSDEEIVKTLASYIHDNVTFSLSKETNTPYHALTVKKSACLGCAMLLDRMLKTAGISSHIVDGEYNGSNHAWNVANINGEKYFVDSTAQEEFHLSSQKFFLDNGYVWTNQ